MSFGLRNAGQTFQRFIDEVTQGLDFVFCYLDDNLLFSRDAAEHREHLCILFQRLADYGLLVNLHKSVIGVTSVSFLGYDISGAGLRPLPDRIAALQAIPLPRTARDLRRYLGMANFYRRFLPRAAHYQAALHEALTGLGAAQPITWTPALEAAFQACQHALSEATLLTHSASNARRRNAHATRRRCLATPSLFLQKAICQESRPSRRPTFAHYVPTNSVATRPRPFSP